MTANGQHKSHPRTGASDSAARRGRLRAAMLSEVARGGYANAKIKQIAKQAGVSTKTFYGLYRDKEECFLEALGETSDAIQSQTAEAIAQARPECAAAAALSVIVQFATAQTDAFYAVTHEALFTSPPAVAQRERLLTGLHAQIEEALDGSSARADAPDLPAVILVSGAIRLLGIAKRRGDLGPDLGEQLNHWAWSYAAPRASHRWRGFAPETALLSGTEQVVWPSTSTPPSEGGPRAVSPAVKRAQRERILLASADAVYRNGYAKTTVADIVAASGLSREVFYSHFRSKQDAFTALMQEIFQQVIGACAAAFFVSERSWPERVWAAGEAMSRLLAANPRLAHAAFVETPYVVGADVMNADQMMIGFTVFLEDGYTYRPEAADKPRIIGEAIGGATFETINRHVRDQRANELPGWLPLMTYMMLAPFTGVRAASQFVDRKIAEHQA